MTSAGGDSLTSNPAVRRPAAARRRESSPPRPRVTLRRPMTDDESQYRQLQQRLTRGWNTFNVHSVTSHVLLPDALAIHLGIKEYRNGQYLGRALIGRQGAGDEAVR